MALQSVKGGLWLPRPIDWTMGGGNPAYSGLLIDAAAEKYAYVFRVPRTGTLDKFEWMTGTVGSIGASVLRCSFQDIGATTGDPDGTQDQYRDISSGITSNTWMVPGLMTSDGTDGGAKRVVTVGDMLCAVVEFQTFAAGASVNVNTVNTPALYVGAPYSDHYTTAWSHQYAAAGGVIALKYNDGSYESPLGVVYPFSALNLPSFASNSTPDERGLKFRLPFPARIKGCYLRAGMYQDCQVVLYDSDGTTALATITHDAQYQAFSSTYAQHNFHPFPSEPSLAKNTYYRLTLKPTTTNAVILQDGDMAAAAIMDAIEGGQDFHYTQRTDAGAWTDTTTRRPWIGLFLSALDDGTGGGAAGGLLTHPGMTGGIRG